MDPRGATSGRQSFADGLDRDELLKSAKGRQDAASVNAENARHFRDMPDWDHDGSGRWRIKFWQDLADQAYEDARFLLDEAARRPTP